VTSFDGDLDDYRRLVLSARSVRASPRERTDIERGQLRDRPEPGKAERKAERKKPLKQKISEAEVEIERISGIIAKIDAALALPDIFTRDPKQAAQLGRARASAASALQRAEEEWLAASSDYEEASS
jgi:ATP-binding cassette, subfamily F, member 3